MKTLRFLFAFVLLAIANNTNAQSGYQSFLNGDSIQWNINHSEESGEFYYVFYVTDTFYIDNIPCRRLKYLNVFNRNGNYYYHEYASTTRQYLCEDTSTGRLWMYFCDYRDTTHYTKKLLVDMSLNVGDTFTFPLYNNTNDDDTLLYVVDSINYINGKKHIFMSFPSGDNLYYWSENVFIEGVGVSNYMFLPVATDGLPSIPEVERTLLCSFKNGQLEFYNDWDYFNGLPPNVSDCFPPISEITQVSSTDIKITAYPNPTKDRITLEFGDTRFHTLRLVNAAGAMVLETALTGHEPQLTLQLKDLPAGIYSCILSGKDGTATQKIVVE